MIDILIHEFMYGEVKSIFNWIEIRWLIYSLKKENYEKIRSYFNEEEELVAARVWQMCFLTFKAKIGTVGQVNLWWSL